VKNLEENAVFAAQLEALVRDHANDIPTMARG
jgi:26S proteasome regulatory subunit T1